MPPAIAGVAAVVLLHAMAAVQRVAWEQGCVGAADGGVVPQVCGHRQSCVLMHVRVCAERVAREGAAGSMALQQ